MRHSGRWLALLLLALAPVAVGAVLFATPARADGDTVALSITNGTSFTYGGTQPLFTAVVTFGTKPTANYAWSVNVKLEDGENFNSISVTSFSQDGMTLTFARISSPTLILAGQHTATASFYDQGTGTTVYSSPVSLSINQASISISCGFKEAPADAFFLGVNQTLQVSITPFSGGGQLPAEWQNDSYTVTFDGPTHITYSNLVSNSDGAVTVTSPAQFGLYSMTCAFSGDANYTPETFTDYRSYTVSAQHALGSAQLFTTPTKLVPNQSYDFYLVLHPATGLPTPTGYFQIWMGNWFTHTIALTSSGNCLIRFLAPPDLSGVSQITIQYWGDINYNITGINFPLTNPPVPGDTGTSSSGTVSTGSSTHGIATPTGPANATMTPSSDATTPTAIGAGNVVHITHPQSGDNGGLILGIIIALLVLVGLGITAGIAIYLLRRRASIAAPGATQLQDGWPGAPTNQWDAPGRGYPPDQRDTRGQGQWDDATQPYRRRDR